MHLAHIMVRLFSSRFNRFESSRWYGS